MEQTVLVGDFGGTNARIGISQNGNLGRIKEYKCASFAGPGAIIESYVSGLKHKPENAVIAVASPADNPEAIIFTNGPWKQRELNFARIGNIEDVKVLNDFEANCFSVAALKAKDCTEIVNGNPPFYPSIVLNKSDTLRAQPSRILIADPKQRFVVIGPGTGLGVGSGHLTNNGQFCVIGGEGGHASFAPTTDDELAVKKYLETEQGMQVTNETFASGTGLKIVFNAYCAIKDQDFRIQDASEIVDLTNSADRAVRDASFWSLRVFARTLGTCASTAALTYNAQTVFVGGGVVPKLGSYFDQISFTEALRQNDLYSNNILKRTPVMLITHKYPGLLGAQAYHTLSQ